MPQSYIPWDEKYKLDIKKIDGQHEKLFTLVNKLYELDEDNYTKEDLRVILYDLNNYMNTHFKDEELFMKSLNYPLYDSHKSIHDKILQTLYELITTSTKLPIIKTKMKVIAKRYLVEHICTEDIKIKQFIATMDKKSDIPDEEIFELLVT